jgi:threonine dehydratase
VRITGESQDEALAESRRLARRRGLRDIALRRSVRDRRAGDDRAGTAGARPDLETILVPLSGGGLAGGIALAAKTIKPDPGDRHFHGPRRGDARVARRRASGRGDEVASLADSLGGGIGLTTGYSFDDLPRPLDDTLLVSEERSTAPCRRSTRTGWWPRAPASSASPRLLAGKLERPKGPVRDDHHRAQLDMGQFMRRSWPGGRDGWAIVTVKGRRYGP